MSYNSEVIVLVISNHSPDYSLNCTPLSPITIANFFFDAFETFLQLQLLCEIFT